MNRAAVTLTALSVLFLTTPLFAQETVPGSLSCEDLGYDKGFPISYPHSGSYHLPSTSDDPIRVVWLRFNQDETRMEHWRSSVGFDGIILTGGPGSWWYDYRSGRSTFSKTEEDWGLSGPGSGTITQVEFCLVRGSSREETPPSRETLDMWSPVRGAKLFWRPVVTGDGIILHLKSLGTQDINWYLKASDKVRRFELSQNGVVFFGHLILATSFRICTVSSTIDAGDYQLRLLSNDGEPLLWAEIEAWKDDPTTPLCPT